MLSNEKSPRKSVLHGADSKVTAESKLSKFKTVTVDEAKQNPEYWQVVKHIFQQQAGRFMQKRFRLKYKKTDVGKAKPLTYFNVDSVRFLRESVGAESDKKIEQLTTQIKKGEWESLDYNDAEFVRNLYKALRLAKISTNEFGTALSLHDIRYEFREVKLNSIGLCASAESLAEIKKFRFEDKEGPYDPKKISYAMERHLSEFKSTLSGQVPPSEQYYFSLNFSRKRTLLLLYHILVRKLYEGDEKLINFLEKYVERFHITDEHEQRKWGIRALKNRRIDEEARQSLLALIKMKEPPSILNFLNEQLDVSNCFEVVMQPERFEKYFQELNVSGQDQKSIKSNIESGNLNEAMNIFYKSYADRDDHLIFLYLKIKFRYAADKEGIIKSLNEFVKSLLNFKQKSGALSQLIADLNSGDGDKKRKAELIFKQKSKTLSKLIADLNNDDGNKERKALEKIKLFIEDNFSTYAQDFVNAHILLAKDYGTDSMVANFLQATIEDPTVEISPDYNPQDINSPLLCRIVPSVSAFSALNKSIHGEDTTSPSLVAGQFGMRLVRNFDEKEEGIRTKQSRAIGVTHPDLIPPGRIHNAIVHDSFVTSHDLSHEWRNSCIKNKPFIRFLRELLDKQKSFYMSMSIDRLSDMDFGRSKHVRVLEKSLETEANENRRQFILKELTAEKAYDLWSLLKSAGRQKKAPKNSGESYVSLWDKLEVHDDNLLLIIDMIIHQKEWTQSFGQSPQLLMHRDNLDPDQDGKLIGDFVRFQNLYKALERDVKEQPCKDLSQAHMFYIILFRLKGYAESVKHYDQIKKVHLGNILHWERNSGLYFYPDFGFGNRVVEELKPEALLNQLNGIVQLVSKYDHCSQSTEQSNIFCILAYRLKDHPQANVLCDKLYQIDLTKILKLRSTDRKLYFRHPATGLLTENALPWDVQELYSVITNEIKKRSAIRCLLSNYCEKSKRQIHNSLIKLNFFNSEEDKKSSYRRVCSNESKESYKKGIRNSIK